MELFEKTEVGTPLLMYDVRISAHGDFCQNRNSSNSNGNCRATFISSDLGMTWENATAHPEMPDPSCKGGIVRWAGEKGQRALFATNPDSYSFRVNQ